MKKNDTMKRKPTEKYLPERFSCVLCGTDRIYNGIVFKGCCICEECVAYLSSFNLNGDQTITVLHLDNNARTVSRKRKPAVENAENAAENRDSYQTEADIAKDR